MQSRRQTVSYCWVSKIETLWSGLMSAERSRGRPRTFSTWKQNSYTYATAMPRMYFKDVLLCCSTFVWNNRKTKMTTNELDTTLRSQPTPTRFLGPRPWPLTFGPQSHTTTPQCHICWPFRPFYSYNTERREWQNGKTRVAIFWRRITGGTVGGTDFIIGEKHWRKLASGTTKKAVHGMWKNGLGTSTPHHKKLSAI